MNAPNVIGVSYQEQERFMQGSLEAYRERPVSEWEIYEFYTGEKSARDQTRQALEAAYNFLWLSTQAKYNRSSDTQEELVVRAITKRQRLNNEPKMV